MALQGLHPRAGAIHLLAIGAIVLAWSYPVWCAGGRLGILDWGYFLQGYEALRRSLLVYHQWPGNNAWTCGGMPLEANPQFGVLSLQTLLALAFGTDLGVRLSVPVLTGVAAWGGWRMATLYWRDPIIHWGVALYTLANVGLACHLTVGHLSFLVLCFFPHLFYYALRMREDPWAGLKAGCLLALTVNDSPGYVLLFGLPILAVLVFAACLRLPAGQRRRGARWIVLATAWLAALAAYRLCTVYLFVHDFPRIAEYRWHFPVGTLLNHLFVPRTDILKIWTMTIPWGGYRFVNGLEMAGYVGWAALALALIGLRRGVNWVHLGIILLFWAMQGNDRWFDPAYWFQKLPGYESLRGYVRIRLFLIFFMGLASARGMGCVAEWAKNLPSHGLLLRLCLWGVMALWVGEPLVVSHLMLRQSQTLVATMPFVPESEFMNVRTLPAPFPGLLVRGIFIEPPYEAIKRNQGWIEPGYGEPNVPGPLKYLLAREDADYVGEYVQNGRSVRPVVWSPNLLRFKGLAPGEPLWLNSTTGRCWYSNGCCLFPQQRVVETGERFLAWPDPRGELEIEYRTPGHAEGLRATGWLMAAACLITGALVFWDRRSRAKGTTSAGADAVAHAATPRP